MFEAIGMRTKIEDPEAIVINTCSDNDTSERGDLTHWSWANPTNRRFLATYDLESGGWIEAVSVEALWQGTKVFKLPPEADVRALQGEWRRGKGKRPLGAFTGTGCPLITDQGEARRRIYLPAYARQIELWLKLDEVVRGYLLHAQTSPKTVYLRDFDTGRGVNRKGPMSHAWVLSVYLNTGRWPEE